MQVWRISKRRHAGTAFSGQGARVVAGRWNPAGIPMVYTSMSLSLAAMETLVHFDPIDEPDFVYLHAELPLDEALLRRDAEMLLAQLPADWYNLAPDPLRQLGATWVKSGSSLAMMVPSAVIEGEWNVLINPTHADAPNIVVGEHRTFRFDPRVLREPR